MAKSTEARVSELEKRLGPREPVEIHVIWCDPDGSRGTGPFYENERGEIIDRSTGRIVERVIRLHWPEKPDITDDWNDA